MSVTRFALDPEPEGPFGPFLGDPEEVFDANAGMAFEDVTPATPDIESDAGVISERIFDRMAERVPGWVAATGGLATIIIEEFSTIAAEIRAEAMTVPEAIFQTYGTEVLGLMPTLAQSAVGYSKWTAEDGRGYLIPAGTQFTLARTGDDLVAFETTDAAEIPPAGAIDVPPEERSVAGVPFRAVIEGSAGNDLSGEGEAIDPFTWVAEIWVDAPTQNGLDAESVERYLAEMILLLRIVALRPVLPWDFAALALRVPGVARAIAMDGYRPSDGTWGHARTITLILTDEQGEPVSLQTRNAVSAYLEALREVNWSVYAIDADYEEIDVVYEVTAFAEMNPDLVRADCDVAIREMLKPSNWRLGLTSPSLVGEVIPPPLLPDGTIAGGWQPGRQTVRVNNFVAQLDLVRGVDYVNEGGVLIDQSASDYVLRGPTTLPKPGAIAGTVNVQ